MRRVGRGEEGHAKENGRDGAENKGERNVKGGRKGNECCVRPLRGHHHKSVNAGSGPSASTTIEMRMLGQATPRPPRSECRCLVGLHAHTHTGMGGWGRSVKVDGLEITRVHLLGVFVQKNNILLISVTLNYSVFLFGPSF